MTDTPENEDIENRGGARPRPRPEAENLTPPPCNWWRRWRALLSAKAAKHGNPRRPKKTISAPRCPMCLNRWEAKAVLIPMLHCWAVCTLYAFGGRGRLSGADVGAKAAAAIKKKTGKKDATKAGTKSEAGGASPASTAPPPK